VPGTPVTDREVLNFFILILLPLFFFEGLADRALARLSASLTG
jgi:hypothetical protein